MKYKIRKKPLHTFLESVYLVLLCFCCYAAFLSCNFTTAYAYAWVAPSGSQNKRLSFIQEPVLTTSIAGTEQNMQMYTQATESKLTIGLTDILTLYYDTIVWNMMDVMQAASHSKASCNNQYTVVQNRIGVITQLSKDSWHSIAARFMYQSGNYYPQYNYYITAAESIGGGLAYGRSFTSPKGAISGYIDYGFYSKLYPHLRHREWRADFKVGLKPTPEIELALGFYRIWGLCSMTRGFVAGLLSQKQLIALGLPSYASWNKKPLQIAKHSTDRIYFKSGYSLGNRKWELDKVLGNNTNGTWPQGIAPYSIGKLWQQLSLVFSYTITF